MDTQLIVRPEFELIPAAVAAEGGKRFRNEVFDKVKTWAKNNQWAVGIAEAAAGAALIAFALKTGAGILDGQVQVIQVNAYQNGVAAGLDAVAKTGGVDGAAMIAGAGVGGLGGIAAACLGTIGIVALGGAVGIPSLILAPAAFLFFGSAGYAVTDIVHDFLSTPNLIEGPAAQVAASTGLDLSQLTTPGVIFSIGLALLMDGCRRILKDKKVHFFVSKVADGIVWLKTKTVEFALYVGKKIADQVEVGVKSLKRGLLRVVDFFAAIHIFFTTFFKIFLDRTFERQS